MKRIFLSLLFFLLGITAIFSQNIPESLDYTRVYDFIDELANNKIITLNSTCKPYSRAFIAEKLREAEHVDSLLNSRQKEELKFYLNDFSLDCGTLPQNMWQLTNRESYLASLLPPTFQYIDENTKVRIDPFIGMDITDNTKGIITKRWMGVSLQATIKDHFSIWGSLSSQSYNGTHLKNGYFSTIYDKIAGAKLSQPTYLNNLPGVVYKEANYGGDYSDMQGGLSYYNQWGSVSFEKSKLQWGDTYGSSNLISGRAPSFPMLKLNIKPTKWLEINYVHGWLVSDVVDSTKYYVEETTDSTYERQYRPANKFMAANMITLTPIPYLNLSIGNAIIYAENNVQAAYLIPIAFYKSLDHTLTKGVAGGGIQNQNSQVFLNVSSRNISHLHLYSSIFIDEFSLSRLKPSNKQRNPVSVKVGGKLSDWPLQNFSLMGEYTRTNIIVYKHSIEAITWASNGYNLGHYLGDNSQEFLVGAYYNPLKNLSLSLTYTDATKYNDYSYIRNDIKKIIAQEPFQDKIWQNKTFAFKAIYEIFNNAYAVINVEYNNQQGYTPTSAVGIGEIRLDAEEYSNKFSPLYLQGKNFTITCGFGFGF